MIVLFLVKSSLNLYYPINVARNIAKEVAISVFVFPCDIEFYPSPDLAKSFMAMVKQRPELVGDPSKKVDRAGRALETELRLQTSLL